MPVPTILITGAARGIGRACAERFAAAGYYVGLYDLEADTLNATAEELADRHGRDRSCHATLDVRDRDSIRAALEHFAEHTGQRMHVLLNNAGVMHVGPFEDIDPDKHRRRSRSIFKASSSSPTLVSSCFERPRARG